MRIEELLNKYFEGNTSAAEEKELRSFFSTGDIPPHLSVYKPMFAYFENEIATAEKAKTTPIHRDKRVVLYLLSGVAAAILLILGLRSVYTGNETQYCAENYVVINGRCYTDIHKVRSMALEALKEVSASAEAYFPDETGQFPEKKTIEMQLKELETLFNEK